jgi:hypothetical protein
VRRGQASVVFVFVFAFCLLAPAFAQAAASYVFDPTLSLTGACEAPTPSDEKPDPGCPEGKHPEAGAFKNPNVTTDAYGDIYVASMMGEEGRIDVFGPDGIFITELKDNQGPQSIAVDSKGFLYAFDWIPGVTDRQIHRYAPTVYEPLKGKIEYSAEPFLVANRTTKKILPSELQPESSIAVDPSTDRLYVDPGFIVAVLGSAAEENKFLENAFSLVRSTSIAVDAVHKKIYVSDEVPVTKKSTIRVFELEAPHKELLKIDGTTTPKGEFLSSQGFLAVDVDDAFGHVFVGDIPSAKKVYEFAEDGTYLATIEHNFTNVPLEEIAVDDGPFSPHPEAEGWLFVPAVTQPQNGHVYAFKPKEIGPPIVEEASVADVTETEATLRAALNPNGLDTTYRLEYITQQQFEEEGSSFAKATIAGEGVIPKGAEGVSVSSVASGLEPATAYRFHVFAENEEGNDEGEREFTTFPLPEPPQECENSALRTGPSALLPDCRAYELVTPPNTNGRPPIGGFSGVYFPTLEASPQGDRASFIIEGGLIPGNEGSGAFTGDLYTSSRTPTGWTSKIASPSGEEATKPSPGSVSPDQAYSFWSDTAGVHIHYPDGHSEFVGRGSLGEDPEVNAGLITENGGHIIFGTKASSAVELEPNSPPAGTGAVYDRSAEGPTHLVSLLPGNVSPGAGEDALYLGASEDGEGIAFEIKKTIYLRLHNAETFEVAGSGAEFAGVADEGRRVFYLEGGDLFAYDAEAEETIPFSSSGDVTPVNVAVGGTGAYFVSPSVLTGEPNPSGEEAEGGAENLYLSEEGAISFVGIVTERDVEGESTAAGQVGGLGLWADALSRPAIDPSRTTPSGTTLLFESRADLTGFESEGFAQVYRYDSTENALLCLSCSPTRTLPSSDASLQSISETQFSPEPGGPHIKIPNQTPDGQRAFFQTAEPLAIQDTDGFLDAYEWEAKGAGSCKKTGGCVYLISGGHSSSPDYLFAMSSSGDDVFFRTADLLLPRDAETTLSLYDARVGGGFAEPRKPESCMAVETCLPDSTPPPTLPAAGRSDGEGN